MAMSSFKTYFDPESLAALQTIFDESWQAMNALPGRAVTGREAEEQRTDLAQMIIMAHNSGMAPERIKAAVLRRCATSALEGAEHSPAGQTHKKAGFSCA
jgi:hypothetical protein